MINEERTFAEIGKNSWDLGKGTHSKVWRICEECGKEDEVAYFSYINSTKLCKPCSNRHAMRVDRGPFNIEYFQSVQNSIVDGYINEIKTFTEFKYYSIDLSSMSGRKVWRICKICGKEDNINYCDHVRRLKRCNSCARTGTNNGFYGETHSDITRKLISVLGSGENNSFYGKHHTEETKRKISAGHQKIAYEEWESFATNSPYCPKFNEDIKEYIRDKYDRRCFLCNRPEEVNVDKNGKQIKLSVHHVDMNKQQGCDGHEWKLVPLCMYCHGTGHTKRMISCIEYILKEEEK